MVEKIPLPRRYESSHGPGVAPAGYRYVPWKECAPFWVNPRGVLVHRVRHVNTLVIGDGRQWACVDYWCENGTVKGDPVLEPPEGRIVCARCEAAAVAKGEPSSSEIVGRHVCVGGVRPYSVCCRQEGN